MDPSNRPGRRARRTAKLLWLLGGVLCLLGCKSAADPTGGETHFLGTCTASDTCADDLRCACGVCTRPCTSADECRELPTAECILPSEPSSCGDAEPMAYCDVTCNVDAECSGLSDSHRCVLNRCRTGPGNPGDGGSGGASTCATGEVEPNQVLVIGDSFFAISHQVTAYLEQLARDTGALEVGERYRDNSSTTANALAMGGNGIANQYQGAAEEAAVEVVIMTGGGPDMLLSSCAAPVAECPPLVAAAGAAEELFDQMAADGVSGVVYTFYPDPVDPEMRERMDALRLLIEPVCANSAVPCHWVDLRTVLADPNGNYLSSDGLIPTAAGSQAIAGAIWATMQRECIAQ